MCVIQVGAIDPDEVTRLTDDGYGCFHWKWPKRKKKGESDVSFFPGFLRNLGNTWAIVYTIIGFFVHLPSL